MIDETLHISPLVMDQLPENRFLENCTKLGYKTCSTRFFFNLLAKFQILYDGFQSEDKLMALSTHWKVMNCGSINLSKIEEKMPIILSLIIPFLK